MIEIRKLTKNFGFKPVLKGIDLTVAQGEFVALLGSNGAGKTTLLRIVASLTRASFGQVRVNNFELPAQADAVRRSLGVVSHHTLLYGDLTAEENLYFYGQLYGVAKLSERIKDVLEMVGLSRRRHDLVRSFSRGMAQRLSIGRAVLHSPEVMLFDEPHTGLDQEANAMLDTLLKSVAAQGRSVLMISHDLPRTLQLAQRVVILAHGKLVYDSPTANLTLGDFAKTYNELTM
jgi:heme ABC exporter ATP-binding subunit CcmA